MPDLISAQAGQVNFGRMGSHARASVHGQQILRGIKFLEGAARVVAQHHEKWDGSGYPLGLSADDS